jgi:hypothetical protein
MKKISQLFVILDDKPGSVGDLTRLLKKKRISIYAIGLFIDTARLHVSDPDLALQILQESGYQVELRDVLRVKLPNKGGAMMDLTQKIGKAGINIDYLYGALSEKDQSGIIILEVDNMKLTLDIFKNHKF